MKPLVLLAATGAAISIAAGQSAKEPPPAPDKATRQTVRVFLAKDGNDSPTTRFSSDAIKVRALWKGSGLRTGDTLHAIWIADDVGATAPKHTTITESSATAYKPDDDGVFALGRPADGWPPGKYRVEIYLNKKLISSHSFVIEHGVTVELNQAPAKPAQTSAPPQLEPSPAVQPKQ